jgi:hypothetical protein
MTAWDLAWVSLKWYWLDLHAIRLTSMLSSDGGCFFRNILVGCIQSYIDSCYDSSITIRSCLLAWLVGSASLTEDLNNFSIMMPDRVGVMEESIHVR